MSTARDRFPTDGPIRDALYRTANGGKGRPWLQAFTLGTPRYGGSTGYGRRSRRPRTRASTNGSCGTRPTSIWWGAGREIAGRPLSHFHGHVECLVVCAENVAGVATVAHQMALGDHIQKGLDRGRSRAKAEGKHYGVRR